MQTLLAIRDAQLEYAAEDHDGDGVLTYASKLSSSPGKRDGLYWPTKPGDKPSPLGPARPRPAGRAARRLSRLPLQAGDRQGSMRPAAR